MPACATYPLVHLADMRNDGPMTAQTAGRVPGWTIFDRLRKAREDAGLSQQQLADLLESPRATVSNWENGRSNPRPLVLRAWAMATGVDRTWLETGEAPHPAGPDGGLSYTARDSNPEPADSDPTALAPVFTFPSRNIDDERRTA